MSGNVKCYDRQDSGFSDNESYVNIKDDKTRLQENADKSVGHPITTVKDGSQLQSGIHLPLPALLLGFAVALIVAVSSNVYLHLQLYQLRVDYDELKTSHLSIQLQINEIRDAWYQGDILEPQRYRQGQLIHRRSILDNGAHSNSISAQVSSDPSPLDLLHNRQVRGARRKKKGLGFDQQCTQKKQCQRSLTCSEGKCTCLSTHTRNLKNGRCKKKRKKGLSINDVDDRIKLALKVKYDQFIGNFWSFFDWKNHFSSTPNSHTAQYLPGDPVAYSNGFVKFAKTETPISIFTQSGSETQCVNYTRKTAVFTVKLSGVFLVHLNLTLVDPDKKSYAAIFVNDRAMLACQIGGFRSNDYNEKNQEIYRICNIDGILDLDKGDRIEARTMSENVTIRYEKKRKASFKFILLHESGGSN